MTIEHEDTSTPTEGDGVGGRMSDREYPFTDWRLPPDSKPKVQYTARYYERSRSRDITNGWWDMPAWVDTPEEVVSFMAKHRRNIERYVIYRVTTTEEIVDTSRMGYDPGEPDQPFYGIALEN